MEIPQSCTKLLIYIIHYIYQAISSCYQMAKNRIYFHLFGGGGDQKLLIFITSQVSINPLRANFS